MIRGILQDGLRWMLAILVATAVGVGLLGRRLPGPPGLLPAIGATRFRIEYQGVDAEQPEMMLPKLIWSPVLFSLPTRYGFSRIRLPEWTIDPPTSLPDPPWPSLVSREERPVAPDFMDVRPQIPGAWHDPSFLPHRHLPPLSSVVQAESGALPDGVQWPLTAEEAGSAPWTAIVQLHVAPEGWPTSIWVDSADAPPAARAAVARRIAAWRWPPSHVPSRVVLRMIHSGAGVRRLP